MADFYHDLQKVDQILRLVGKRKHGTPPKVYEPARNCVRIILLKNNAEIDIAMLEKNYGGFDKIIEQLIEEVRLQKQVKDSRDFQKISNLVEN
jgi:hypothetical protein